MQPNLISRIPKAVSGPAPLLFIHGPWHAAWCWDEHFLGFFAGRGWEAHAVDLRGHGDTPGTGALRTTSIADYLEDVTTAVEAMDGPPVLIGHSMGGLLVQRYLERHVMPAAVLLASVPVRGAWRASVRMMRRHPIAAAKAHLRLRLRPIVDTPSLAADVLFSPETPSATIDRHVPQLQDESYRAYVGMLTRWPRPRRVVSPILVLGAADDQVFHPSEVAATAAAYRTSADIFPSMGHAMMLEPGWESVADRIEKWLRTTL